LAKGRAGSPIAHETGKNGVAAGFALFFHTFSTFLGRRGLWLEDVFVYPEHRGAGLGRQLLAQLAAIARQRDCGRFEWSVLDWNAPAIRFYERMGATVLPEWRIVRVTGDALARFGLDRPSNRLAPGYRPVGRLAGSGRLAVPLYLRAGLPLRSMACLAGQPADRQGAALSG
jgi:GNAT superfamily N-acetyltransferase